jgi:hypothetical protein
MKKIFIAATIFSVIFMASSLCLAADEKDWNVSVGYKAWMNEWQTSVFSNDITTAGEYVTSLTSDAKLTSIPVLGVRYKDFFVSGSYYMKTRFSFPEIQTYEQDITTDPVSYYDLKTKITAERSEWDTALGYYINKSIALSLGYKSIKQKYTQKMDSVILSYSDEYESKTKIEGPTVGLMGNVNVGNGFGLYGNFAYGWLKAEYDGVSEKDDVRYILNEFGVNHKAENLPLVISLGYRYQAMDTTIVGSSHKSPDVTKGFVFGINLIF